MRALRIGLLAVALLVPAALSAGPAAAAQPTGVVRSWVTDLSTDQRLAPQAPKRWGAAKATDASTIVVDPTRRYQTMAGFGASMTDSSAYVLSGLPRATRQSIMKELFSPDQGIGLSAVRQPMGASDLARGNYSYDDQPAGKTDPTLADFSVAHDRAYILPRLKEALRLNPELTTMASPWSPPGWMKDSGSMVTGTLKPQYYAAYARYFVKFLKAYERAGVPTDYVTPQNEPLYEPAGYPGMDFPASDETAFVGDHLGPAIARSGVDTKILGYDHNWDAPAYPEQLYADADAARYVPGTAWHCYGGSVSAQTASHNDYPHSQAFLTECSGGTWQGTDEQAFKATMASVIGVPRNWGQSVILWNLALDDQRGPQNGGCDTCRGVVTVHDDGTVSKELEYWGLGHASKFVRPGAVRVASSQPVSGLSDVAYTNPDGSGVLVAYNGRATSRSFVIKVGDRSVKTSLAAGAAATYTWDAPGALAASSDDLGWTDLDLGVGPAGTPGGRLVQSVTPGVVASLDQVRVGSRWLAYSRPYGSTLTGPATRALSRADWTVKASASAPADPVANLVDGDPATRWSSGTGQSDGLAVTVDLGRRTTFSQVVMDAGSSPGDYVRGYELQTSADGTRWTPVARGRGATGAMTIALPPTTTRYLRIVSTESSGSWWSIHELTLRTATGSIAQRDTGRLSSDHGRLGTKAIEGVYNRGTTPARVAFPIAGFPYRYTLPPTAAVTFATWS